MPSTWRAMLIAFAAAFLLSTAITLEVTGSDPAGAARNTLTGVVYAQDGEPPADSGEPTVLGDRIVYPDGTQTVFYRCQNRTPADLIGIVNQLVPGFNLHAYAERNILIVERAPAERLAMLNRVLEWVDAPRTQVLIEIKVVSLTYDRDFQVGYEQVYDESVKTTYSSFFKGFETTFHPDDFLGALSANPPPNNPNPSQIASALQAAQGAFQGASFRFATVGSERDSIGALDLTVRTLAGTGRVSVLSRPAILCEDGFTAQFNAGDEVPIQTVRINNNTIFVDTQFKQTGISLKVTPTLVGDGFVTLVAEPEISAVSQFFDPGASGLSNPIIVTRKAKTTVHLASGQTLEIGGLRSTRTLFTATGIPFLMDIPILGYLFRSTRREVRRQDIIFWITPTILPSGPGATGTPLDFLRDRTDPAGGGDDG